MALFKIKKGLKQDLPTTYNEGYCYFTTDDGKFYIDTTNTEAGRVVLNALKADQDSNGNIIINTYLPISNGIARNLGVINDIDVDPSVTTTYYSISKIYAPESEYEEPYTASQFPPEGNILNEIPGGVVGEWMIKYPVSNYWYRVIDTATGEGYYRASKYNDNTDTRISLRLYNLNNSSIDSTYTDILFPASQRSPSPSNQTYSLAYVSSAVGDNSTPVYVKDTGEIAACTNISTVGLVHIGASEPTSTNYTLWVDTDKADSLAMRSDAIKYKAFSIATSAWSGSGPYSYVISAPGITANSAILNLTLDAASQTYQKAQLDWETGANSITLSTSVKPTGTLSGYLIAVDVTVI